MKLNNIFIFAAFAAASLSFTSCSKSNDDVTPEAKASALTVDVDTVKVGVGESAEFNIKTGNDTYKVFSENPSVATVQLQGTKVSVTSLVKGKTGVVISDAKGNYKRVPIQSMYMKLTLDKEAISAKMKLGNSSKETIKVLAGNGEYKATVDANIATASVNGNEIEITSTKEGKATITITDMMGLTAKVALTVETTTNPYTDAELTDLKASKTVHYSFNGTNVENESSSWYDYYNQKDGELTLYGYNYYDEEYFKIWFGGDKSVGKKTNAKITYKTYSYHAQEVTVDPINFEIIQNDGTLIWAVYSFIKDNKLYYGNFCQKINAE